MNYERLVGTGWRPYRVFAWFLVWLTLGFAGLTFVTGASGGVGLGVGAFTGVLVLAFSTGIRLARLRILLI